MTTGFSPPPYPQDRVAGLRELAAMSGDSLDLSIGDPCDPLPEVVAVALRDAVPSSVRYPVALGTAEFRAAASDWMARRLGVQIPASDVLGCLGTKEVVAGLPRILSLRDPGRDTVLYPAISYPTYAMGAALAGLRAVPVPLDAEWHLDLTAVSDEDADRTLLLWVNEPGNPTGSVATKEWFVSAVEWTRQRGIVVASDECYVEFSFDHAAATALSAGAEGVLAVHSLSKRSNMAGLRAGFVAGDPEIVAYLGEVRRHAGLMVPSPVQEAAVAALGDDAHVAVQSARYRERRDAFLAALHGTEVAHDGGPGTFYLWLADRNGRDGWGLGDEFAKAGVVGSPGDLFGEAPAAHLRVALVTPMDRLEPALGRLRSVLGAR